MTDTPGAEVRVVVRNTQARDFEQIGDLCHRVYPDTKPWLPAQLASHLHLFPEGQFVAVDRHADERVVGMGANLIVRWERYDMLDSWEDFTSDGMFTHHDPTGQTLYGAEAIVDPTLQGHGIGGKLYRTRSALVEQLRLLRIRGGARLRNYHQYASRMSAADYVIKIVHKELDDPTLSFQLHEGFHVLAVVPHYLNEDPDSLGYAALIEWLNPNLAKSHHTAERPTTFLHRDVAARLRATPSR